MPNFVPIPRLAAIVKLTHAQHHVLFALCAIALQHRSVPQKPKWFPVDDRQLAQFSGCGTRAIFMAKKALKEAGLIQFRVTKHVTNYLIIYEIWSYPHFFLGVIHISDL